METLYIGLGATFGGMLRMFLGNTFNRGKAKFPHGTFIANTLGSFLIGIMGGLAMQHLVPSNYHLFIATGFCGSLTTFSTFSLEILCLVNREKHIIVLLYIIGTALSCLALSVLGVYLGGRI